MPRPVPGFVYVGIRGNVVALDRRDGTEVWRTPLKGSQFAYVHRDGDLLLATAGGEVFCLDPKSGALIWHNPLKGLGLGLTTIAGDSASTSSSTAATVAAEVQRRQAAAAAAAAG
jgi:outer membrane protein assembly factor BamB